jgi:hypothetical protein
VVAIDALPGDPLGWLLDPAEPAVRHRALRELLDRPADDAAVAEARTAAMATGPIAAILDAQHPDGWWVAPGSGYLPKYTGTTWQVVFLDQLGADGADPRVHAACSYVLTHAQTSNGGFGARTSGDGLPPPSSAIHCLNGNLLRALLGLGWQDDPRVARSVDWQAAAITGEGAITFYRSSMPGPGFRCGANDGEPCAWGAVKAVLALARVPAANRTATVQRALDAGVAFLLSCDPATAAYPVGFGGTRPNGSWFKPGFPLGYVADVLQVLEAACEAGAGDDARLGPAIRWLLDQQVAPGRWPNRYPYTGKLVADIDRPGESSRWVTLRALRVLRMAGPDAVAAAGICVEQRG